MSKIGDELRKFVDEEDLYPRYIAELRRIADCIDAEMVELPKDADLEPIHVGDKVRVAGRGNVEFKVDHITFFEDRTRVEADGKGEFAYSKPTDLTHVRPDSLERIADDLDLWCNSVSITKDECVKPHDLAERIRKLAANEAAR